MSVTIFVSWVLVGVLVGALAGFAMKRGGYGLQTDLVFGLVGSIGVPWILRAYGVFADAGIGAMATVACIGAVLSIVAQRKIWPADRRNEEKANVWWRWALGHGIARGRPGR